MPAHHAESAKSRDETSMREYRFRTIALPKPARKLAKAALSVLADVVKDDNVLYEFDLALTEACANVVKHAYGKEKGDLEIVMRVEEAKYVDIEVADWGVGFGPDFHVKDKPAPINAESGRGIFIISKLMDTLEFKNAEGRNSLLFHKTIEKNAWKTCK
jgi:serine/threonine-protein kinase RsbW